MFRIDRYANPRVTPQHQPIPGREHEMVQNEAGGHGFKVDKWQLLERFLLLGTEGGTFYTSEQELSQENARNVLECIKEDGQSVVQKISEVSLAGKAAKNDYALFALALAMKHGDVETRKAAYLVLSVVARTGTHLFQLLTYVDNIKGWSAGLRRAVGRWYSKKSAMDLAYQMVKYQQRYGFSHRDALRLAHPSKGITNEHAQLFNWATKGVLDKSRFIDNDLYLYLAAVEAMLHQGPTAHEAIELIEEYDLPREVIPSELQSNPAVLYALLGGDGKRMPLGALVRNLGRLTSYGVLSPMSDISMKVAKRLSDPEAIRRARIHPFAIFVAARTYASGGGVLGKLTWNPISAIMEALEAAFYNAFDNVEPSGKRVIYAVDTSGSMGGGGGYWSMPGISGLPGVTPAQAAAAITLTAVRTEERTETWGFDTSLYNLELHKRSSLADAQRAVSIGGGGTDCSLPFQYALQQKIEADAIVMLTDSQTWFGDIHPVQAIEEYRRKVAPGAKLVVVSMTANNSTIGDIKDPGTLEVVGLSTETPRLVTEFIRG